MTEHIDRLVEGDEISYAPYYNHNCLMDQRYIILEIKRGRTDEVNLIVARSADVCHEHEIYDFRSDHFDDITKVF